MKRKRSGVSSKSGQLRNPSLEGAAESLPTSLPRKHVGSEKAPGISRPRRCWAPSSPGARSPWVPCFPGLGCGPLLAAGSSSPGPPSPSQLARSPCIFCLSCPQDADLGERLSLLASLAGVGDSLSVFQGRRVCGQEHLQQTSLASERCFGAPFAQFSGDVGRCQADSGARPCICV